MSEELKALPKGGKFYGRGGLPPAVAAAMYEDYRRLNSVARVGELWGRSRQGVWEIFKTAGYQLNGKRFHEGVYKGRKYTPGKNGYLRDSLKRGRGQGEAQLHRVIWQDHFGPIPAGHQVYFKDGDKRNFKVENLGCAPVGEVSRITNKGDNQFTRALAAKRVEENMGWVVRQAQRIAPMYRGVCFEDLLQQGRLGLLRASKSFDPNKGANFLTYATWWVRSYMQKFCRKHGAAVRGKNGFVPEVRSLDAAAFGSENSPSHLELLVGADGESVSGGADLQFSREGLEEALKRLSAQQREILHARFFEGLTLEAIAPRYGVTRERIRQIEFAALRRLRKAKEIRRMAA